jgi:hypothetical protein
MNFTIEQLQDHFRRIYSIIGFISRTAKGRGGICKGFPGPNPFYGQSHDLGIILGEYYGHPSGLMTPLGWLEIDRPCVIDESWRPVVKEALGLEPYYGEWRKWAGKEEYRGIISSQGEHGPAWALLRDTDGNPLDEPQTPIKGWFLSPSTEMRYTYHESLAIWKKHIEPIFTG